jgi:hypothetical protein
VWSGQHRQRESIQHVVHPLGGCELHA